MEYVIRKIRESEIERLVEMCSSHAEYEQASFDSTDKASALRVAIFSEQRLVCYVIEAEQLIVGYFTYTFDFSTWDARQFLHLDCLYLEASYRGLRIADRVFEILVADARHHNCVNIQWQTPSFNQQAIKFYNRIGAKGKDKVRFELTL